VPILLRGLTSVKFRSAITQGLAYFGVYKAGSSDDLSIVSKEEKLVIWGGIAFVVLLLLKR
jgi:hypothetical protein